MELKNISIICITFFFIVLLESWVRYFFYLLFISTTIVYFVLTSTDDFEISFPNVRHLGLGDFELAKIVFLFNLFIL